MNVKELTIEGLTTHASTKLQFPEKGVVLVTGPNGSGKSSIAEALCVGMWGETLRGASPWREGKDGRVTVVTDQAVATRERKGTRSKLSWNLPDQPVVDYETSSKAQEALEAVVGSFSVWRRSRVFSSQDASHFTLATDGERKRLLETILGLDKFDTALDACKADFRKQAEVVNGLLVQTTSYKEKLESAKARIGDADKALAQLGAPDGDPDTLLKQKGKLEEWLKTLSKEESEIEGLLREADRGDGKRQAVLDNLTRKAERLAGKDECDQCGQEITKDLKNTLNDLIAAEGKALQEEQRKAKAKLVEFEAQLAEIREERKNLQARLRDGAEVLAKAQQVKKQREFQESQIESHRSTYRDTEALLSSKTALLQKAQVSVGELEACTQILGLKGVRAHVLGKALTGLEAVSNRWLSKIAGKGMKLRLSPYTEKKSGGVSDSIALEVDGAGGGHGYKGASGGERRRIDVALLLALAEVAQAAQGGPRGTLFFDEVLDALDEDGVEAVSAALEELAADRAIVVISHSRAMLENLKAVVRWQVKDGVVTVA